MQLTKRDVKNSEVRAHTTLDVMTTVPLKP